MSVRVDVGGGENGVLRGCAADAPTVAAMVGVVLAVVFIMSCEAPPQSCHVDFQQNINQYFVFGFARRHNNHGSTPPTRGRLRAPTIQAGPRISADLHSATPQRAWAAQGQATKLTDGVPVNNEGPRGGPPTLRTWAATDLVNFLVDCLWSFYASGFA